MNYQHSEETKLLEEQLSKIAKERLGIPTLAGRGRDSLDFHEVHVHALYEAFVDVAIYAYRAGWKRAEIKLDGQLNKIISAANTAFHLEE